MGIDAIPNELCLLIAEELPIPDLYSLLLACRGLSHLLTPLLHELGLRDRGELTALQWAAKHGHESLVELAILNGAKAYERTDCENRFAPLHLATMSEKPNLNVIETLVKHGAPVDALDSEMRTPLRLATQAGSELAVEMLLGLGARMTENHWLRADTVAHIAASRNDVGCTRAFVVAGVDLQARGFRGRTILHEALYCTSTRLETARYILGLEEARLIVNAKNDSGSTPLHLLVGGYGNYLLSDTDMLGMVKLLLQCGADVHAKDNYGDMPAHILAKSVGIDSMRELIRAGFDINTKGGREETVLHRAAYGRPKMTKYLLEMEGGRIGINAQNLYGKTPLHRAVQAANQEVVELLLGQKADTEIEDREGDTPALLVHRQGNSGVGQAFIDAGVDFDFGDMLRMLLETKTTCDENTRVLVPPFPAA